MGEKSLPFYRLLKGETAFEWTVECQHTFDQLKEYLSHPPLLVSLVEGETLFMYLAVTKAFVSSVICAL